VGAAAYSRSPQSSARKGAVQLLLRGPLLHTRGRTESPVARATFAGVYDFTSTFQAVRWEILAVEFADGVWMFAFMPLTRYPSCYDTHGVRHSHFSRYFISSFHRSCLRLACMLGRPWLSSSVLALSRQASFPFDIGIFGSDSPEILRKLGPLLSNHGIPILKTR
jgi:hypothetical protein